MSELLGKPVQFATDTVGPDASAKVQTLKDGEVILLENVRFNPGEKEGGEPSYAATLASWADVYCNDGLRNLPSLGGLHGRGSECDGE